MALLHLAPRRKSRDAIVMLDELLADARAGKLIGIAYVAMYQDLEYVVNIAGETKRSPTFTRGMLALLDDKLSQLIRMK